MVTVLVATASVHTTAAACDYFDGRLGVDDSVVVLSVVDDTTDERDAGDALNVAGARLPTAETVRRAGDPAEEILAVAADSDADEILVGTRRGVPGTGTGLGNTAQRVVAGADRPVVVLPCAAPA